MEEEILFECMKRLADETFVIGFFRFSQGDYADHYAINITFQDLYGINFHKRIIIPDDVFNEEEMVQIIRESYDELRLKINRRHTQNIDTCKHKEVQIGNMKVCKLCLKDPVEIETKELYKQRLDASKN